MKQIFVKTHSMLSRLGLCGLSAFAFVLFFGGSSVCHAQWRTQDFELSVGWNAIYLHVDPSFTGLEDFVDGTPIKEVWLWAPTPSSVQFIESPQDPIDGGASWIQWNKDDADPDLKNMIGNAAYLVNLTDNYVDGDGSEQVIADGETFKLNIIGQPMAPVYDWSADGQNFIGFQTPDVSSGLVFDTFFSPVAELQDLAVIYEYQGGAIEENPVARSGFEVETNRNEAFWIRAPGVYNDYFGPFQLTLQDHTGVHLGDSVAQYRIRIKNVVESDLTVTLSIGDSEAIPDWDGIPEDIAPILGVPPVLVRGTIDLETLTYDYTDLNAAGSESWDLAPAGESGSEVEIVLGVNRAILSGEVGDLFAGILQFSDNLGYLEVEVPVSANVASLNGLWVGEADVSKVRHDLTFFETNDEGTVFDEDGNPTVLGSDVSFGSVARSYSMRMIVHLDSEGTARLMQRVYFGRDKDNDLLSVLATIESALHGDYLEDARRLSSAHLPWTPDNDAWTLDGNFGLNELDLSGVNLQFAAMSSEDDLPENTPDHVSKVFLGDFGDDLVIRIFDALGDQIADEVLAVPTSDTSEIHILNSTAESLVGMTATGYELLEALQQTEAALTLSDPLINYALYSLQIREITESSEAPTDVDGLAGIVYLGELVPVVDEAATSLLIRIFDESGNEVANEDLDLTDSPSTELTDLMALIDAVQAASEIMGDQTHDILTLVEALTASELGLVSTTDYEIEAATITSDDDIPADRLEYSDLLFVGSFDEVPYLRIFDEDGVITQDSAGFLLESAGDDLDELILLLENALELGAISAEEEAELVSAAETLLSRAQVVTQVEVSWSDQAANPFLHTYHPDHDNRDSEFNSTPLDIGRESYQIVRDIGMLFTVPEDNFDSLTTGMERLSGDYAEEVTLIGKEVAESDGGSHFEKKTYGAQGEFVLRRISQLDDLQFE